MAIINDNSTYMAQLQQMNPVIDRLLATIGNTDDVCLVMEEHIRTRGRINESQLSAALDRDIDAVAIVHVQSETIELELQLQSGTRRIAAKLDHNVYRHGGGKSLDAEWG